MRSSGEKVWRPSRLPRNGEEPIAQEGLLRLVRETERSSGPPPPGAVYWGRAELLAWIAHGCPLRSEWPPIWNAMMTVRRTGRAK